MRRSRVATLGDPVETPVEPRPAGDGGPPADGGKRRLPFRAGVTDIGLPVAMLIIVVVFTIVGSHFMAVNNWVNIGRQTVPLAVVAMGLGLVMIGGGLDLSIGSAMSLTSVCAALIAEDHGLAAGIGAGLVVGLSVGLFNGILVAGAGVPPFIATLGMLSVAAGAALLLSDGVAIHNVPDGFDWIGVETWFGVPVAVSVGLVLLLVLGGTLRFTRFGRHIYAVGGDERAAWLSGVNVRWVKYRLYAISGLMAGIGGLILSSRVNSGQPTLGDGRELDAVAAVLIGGVRLGGGEGSLWKIALAAVFLTTLDNGLSLANVESFWQDVAVGLIIAAAALANAYRARGLGPMRFVRSLFSDVSGKRRAERV